MPTEPFFFEAIPPRYHNATDGHSGEQEGGRGRGRGRGRGERGGRLGMATGRVQTAPPSNGRRLHNQNPEPEHQQGDLDINDYTRQGSDRFWWWKFGGLLLLVMVSHLVIISLIEAIHDGVPLSVIIQNRHALTSSTHTSFDCDQDNDPPLLSVSLPSVPSINLTAVQSLNNKTTTTILTPLIPHQYNTTNATLTHLLQLLSHPLSCALRALSLHQPPSRPSPTQPFTSIKDTHAHALALSTTHLPTLLDHFTAISPVLNNSLQLAKADLDAARLPRWYVWRIRYFQTALFFNPQLSTAEEAYLAAGTRYNVTRRAWEEHEHNAKKVVASQERLEGLTGDLEELWRGVLGGEIVDEENEAGEETHGGEGRGKRRRLVKGVGRGGNNNNNKVILQVKNWYFDKVAGKGGMRWDEFERIWERMVCEDDG